MSPATHRYGIYGLSLVSNRPLPGFAADLSDGARLVLVDFAGAPMDAAAPAGSPFCSTDMETLWHRDDGGWSLRYVDDRDGAQWSVDIDPGGRRLTVRWTDDRLLADIPPVLQGGPLAAALHLQGVPALHAAVIDVGGVAIALVGASGAGKSTTAAAFVGAGYAALTDDVAALTVSDGSVLVESGPPRLRATPASAAAAGFRADELSRVFTDDRLGPKLALGLSASAGTFRARPLRLGAVYRLAPRAGGQTSPSIEPLPVRAAVPVLLNNLYAARFLDRARVDRLTREVVHIAGTVAVRSVVAGDDLAALPALVAAIVEDAHRVTG